MVQSLYILAGCLENEDNDSCSFESSRADDETGDTGTFQRIQQTSTATDFVSTGICVTDLTTSDARQEDRGPEDEQQLLHFLVGSRWSLGSPR